MLRAADQGWSTWYEPAAVIEHIGGESGTRPSLAALADRQQGQALPTAARPGRRRRLLRGCPARHALPCGDRPAHGSGLGRRPAVPLPADHVAGAASMTALRLVGFADLTGAELDTWHALRAGNPLLDSPYFDPAFAAAVHASGADVTVAVDGRGRERHQPAGRPSGRVRAAPGRVAGRRLPGPGPRLRHAVRPARSPRRRGALLRVRPPGCCRVRRASPGSRHAPARRTSRSREDSTATCRGPRRAAGTTSGRPDVAPLSAEREWGPVTFRAQSSDPEALAWLVKHKRAQYAATGARDYFASPGRRALLSLLLHTEGAGVRGNPLDTALR